MPNGQIGTRKADIRHEKFDPLAFLAKSGIGRKVLHLKAKAVLFSQGDDANAVFYIQGGRAKLTVVSKSGKQATITLLSTGDFVGEESVAAVSGPRLATATAITACTVLKITRDEMVRVIHEEHFPNTFWLSCSLEACGLKRISSINFSIPAKRGSRECCC